jgi:YHS domain-containing protein
MEIRMSMPNITSAIALWLALGASVPCAAGEYFERNGAALDGYDAVAYFVDGKPVAGSSDLTVEHKGSVFRFASVANRDKFRAMPDAYAPQYGGFCAYGTAGGYKAKIDPAAWSIVNGKLYLNYDAKVQAQWNRDRAGYIVKADGKWPDVAKQTKVIQ